MGTTTNPTPVISRITVEDDMISRIQTQGEQGALHLAPAQLLEPFAWVLYPAPGILEDVERQAKRSGEW